MRWAAEAERYAGRVSTPAAEFERTILNPDLSVNSGVYSAIDPSIRMRLNARGEYEYYGPSARWYEPRASELLSVSAFAAKASESDLAADLFPAAGGAMSHPVLGNFHGLYAGFAAEGDYRANGSSGGLTTWLLTELVATGQIDGVIHMVATPGKETLFAYQISDDRASIAANAKSRYYPGELSDVLAAAIESGKRYAITAIPSFAFEVRLLQRVRPDFATHIPFVIGLICGHQKTANYAKQLAWRAGIAPADLRAIDFRSKDPNAGANRYRAEIRGEREGQEVVAFIRQGAVDETDWGLGMFKSNFSDYTEDAFNETADAVFGDAWLPEYVNDSMGTNVVIARDPRLNRLLIDARDSGRIHLEPLSPQRVLDSQSALVKHSVQEVGARFAILRRKGEYAPDHTRRQVKRISPLRREIQKIRIELSRLSHDAWVDAYASGDLQLFDSRMKPAVARYRRLQEYGRMARRPANAIRRMKRLIRRG